MRVRTIVPLAAALALVGWAALPALASEVAFERITGNAPTDVAGQLFADVTETTAGAVEFRFFNTGEIDAGAAICDVYFDDGALVHVTGATIANGPGVKFGWGASPGDLPGGQSIDPPFEATEFLNSDSDSPVYRNGIGAGESLRITFTGVSFSDVWAGIVDGSLRIGLHVQGIDGPLDESDSFVNHRVPEPGTVLLVGAGALALAAARRRRG